MSFLKKISNAFSSLGNNKTKNNFDIESTEESIVEDLVGVRIGNSSDGQLNVGIQELSGYLFLETFILSNANIKTFDGAKLTFKGEKDEFKLSSDTQEIKSDLADKSFKYITQISFDITEEKIERIKKGDYLTIQLDFKRKSLVFNKII